MFHLGSFENSLRSDPKKRVTRRVSDVQQRARIGPKSRPPRIVGVQAKKTALRSSESLTDSAVDVSSQEETDVGVNDSLVSLIWRLGKPKEKLQVNEFEELCSVDVLQTRQEEKCNELETLLESLKTVDVVQKSTVKDLITNFETKSKKVYCKILSIGRI